MDTGMNHRRVIQALWIAVGFLKGCRGSEGAKLEFLTDVLSGYVGAGGSPGESVRLVLAASTAEPQTVMSRGDVRLNIDRGNQSKGVASGVVLGTMANTVLDCGARRWESKMLNTPVPTPLAGTADEKGVLWVLVGFDSGFEALSRLYYQRLTLNLQPG